MNKYVRKLMLKFQNDIINVENSNLDIDAILNDLTNAIKKDTGKYFKTEDYQLREKIKDDLIRQYNLLYYYQAKKNGIRRAYMLDDDIESLPMVYLIDQSPERFEIDYTMLENINVSEGLTIEQASELLKWTVNNTRDNLIVLQKQNPYMVEDVYGNSSLGGACGFAQFSSLYPLQKMGFDITINNVVEVNGGRHAFGTVIIPIKIGDKIVKKRFLIDCTYRQFFTIPYNVVARYLSTVPDAAFFINQSSDKIEFAKELLKNGFFEANLENLKKYLMPFFARSVSVDDIKKIDEEFRKLDIIDILENNQSEFDYSEEEFIEWGCNLELFQTISRN